MQFNRWLVRLMPALLIAALVMNFIGPSTAQANPGWYNTSWQYRKQITINGDNVTASLTNFPVLINLTTDTDLAADAQDDADDILFTAADEVTKLSHEIESFNGTTGKLVAWVKIPSLPSPADTAIYMYYGNAGAANQQDATAVWDSNFRMVQHLEETTGGANAIKDSTANNNHGTDGLSPTLGATGKIDGATGFSSATGDNVTVADSNSLDITPSITLEAWIYPTALDAVHRRILVKPIVWGSEPYYEYSLWVYNDGSGNDLGFGISDGTTRAYSWNGTLAASTWQHVAGTFNGTHMKWYINGNLVATKSTGTITSIGANNQPLFIAAAPTGGSAPLEFGGTIDEVRVSSTDRSTDWLKTSYNNQNNPSVFITLGAEENAPTVPTVTTDAATAVEETTATLNGTVTSDGGEACQYRFQWGTSPGVYTDSIGWTDSKTTGQPFNAAISSLSKGTKYYFIAEVKNSAGVAGGAELDLLTKPDEPVSLSATPVSSSQIDLSWTKGDGANRTMVRSKLGSYPTSVTDGDEVYFDTGTSASDTGLTADTEYFYSAWSEVSGSQQWSDAYVTASATTNAGGPPVAIGGIVSPTNKVAVLAPWGFLGLMLSMATVRIILRHRSKK